MPLRTPARPIAADPAEAIPAEAGAAEAAGAAARARAPATAASPAAVAALAAAAPREAGRGAYGHQADRQASPRAPLAGAADLCAASAGADRSRDQGGRSDPFGTAALRRGRRSRRRAAVPRSAPAR